MRGNGAGSAIRLKLRNELHAFVAARKDGEHPIGAGQFQNDAQLAVEAAQIQLLTVLPYPLESGHEGAESAAIHELNIAAIDQDVSGVVLQQRSDSGADI